MKLSYNTIRSILRPVLATKHGEGYIEDVFSDSAIYCVYAKDSMGSTKACYQVPFTIDKAKKVTLGTAEKVQEVTTYEKVAQFALEREGASFTADGMIERSGKLFELGEYPDKGFALNETEADELVTAFTPVSNDLEHVDTILNGELGQLTSIERVGTELRGKVKIPTWLDKLVGEKALGVSLAFDKQKRIVGNALTLNPRITSAAVFAAFAEARPERPETAPAQEATPTPGGKPKMKLSDFFAFFGINPDARPDDEVAFDLPKPKTEDPAPAFAKSASELALEAEVATLKAERLVAQEARLGELAVAFAEDAVKTNRAIPAEKDSLVALFSLAARDDSEGTITFSAEGALVEGPRIKALKEAMSARAPHTLTQEQIASLDKPTAFKGDGDAPDVDPARIEKLTRSTSLGNALMGTNA